MRKKLGIVSILFTTNNVICSLTTLNGLVLAWTSSGSKKVTGSKKLTLAGMCSAVRSIMEYALKTQFTDISLRLKGVSKYKKLIMKSLISFGLQFSSISDITSVPHNGCRLKRTKRI
uniref:Ribosomal protein S11 n=1 Tax=Thorea hispida TaxID=202687 RepID=A0A1Z1XAU3_9FLOR|nr:ribosomal protein S11 [Thorea hispida]ARX95972.1 ribosomal protein S11 [Thorea hispida]